MSAWKVPLTDVVVPSGDIELVAETYRSGWLSMGPETESFEAAFSEFTGAAHAVAVTNGTAALHLCCMAAGFGAGDEVIVPSMTFVASANAIAYTGARPVFADIVAPDAPWLSAAAAEAAITSRTAGIMTVHYGGHVGETEALRELASRRGLVLLEDAAHAAGSRLGDRHLGRFGAAGAFSFFSNKNLATGEGGAVITDDPAIAERVRLLRSHGMTTLTWDRHRGHAASYDVVVLGCNYRIDEPRATLARARLARLDGENRSRARLDARYRALLADIPCVTPISPPGPGLRSAHHLFTLVLGEDLDRDEMRAAMASDGIQTSVHYPPAHRFAIYRDRSPAELPVTDAYGARTLTLPLFPHMSEAQQDFVVDRLSAALTAAQPLDAPSAERSRRR